MRAVFGADLRRAARRGVKRCFGAGLHKGSMVEDRYRHKHRERDEWDGCQHGL